VNGVPDVQEIPFQPTKKQRAIASIIAGVLSITVFTVVVRSLLLHIHIVLNYIGFVKLRIIGRFDILQQQAPTSPF
jgi:hypothetical protein